MTVDKKGQNNIRPKKEQYKRKRTEIKINARPQVDHKPCIRYGRGFVEGRLKNCPQMGKSCKNCNKSNHFAKMCRSQQMNEVTENTTSSDKECNLIQNFDSCNEFKIMSIEIDYRSIEQIEDYI